MSNPLDNQRGAILIFLLVAVTLLGLMAGIAGSSWQTTVQRAKEQELLWRGSQIRKAIGSYYTTAQAGSQAAYPRSIEHLLKDPRFAGVKRHLRRHYLDPFSGEEFVLIKDQGGRIKGVRSSNEQEPFKKDNFQLENEKLVGKTKYAEWEFVYTPDKKKNSSSTVPPGSPGTTPQPPNSPAPPTGQAPGSEQPPGN